MKMHQRVLIASDVVLLFGFVAGLLVLTQSAMAQDQLADMENGKAVYDHWCSHCHNAGRGMTGTQGLAIKYRETGIPAALKEREDLTPELVKTFVRQGVLSMAPFRKTEITDAQLEDLAAYLSKKK